MKNLILFIILFFFSFSTYSNHIWDSEKKYSAEIYSTIKSEKAIPLVKKWHKIAIKEWGNYGPLEIYLVGKNKKEEKKLEKDFCKRHIKLDKEWKIKLKSEGKNTYSGWKKKYDCANSNYKIFTRYADEGNAAVSTYFKDHLNYNFYTLIMSHKRPAPNEKDYGQVFLHEYFHVYQHSHVSDRCSDNRNIKCERNKKTTGEYEKRPWLMEGGAELMSILLYSRTIKDFNYFIDRMSWKLDSRKEYISKYKMNLKRIVYGNDQNIAYDIGSWFVAFLIYHEGEDKYLVDFHNDIDSMGFEKSFEKNFHKSSDQYINEFNDFIKQSPKELFSLLNDVFNI